MKGKQQTFAVALSLEMAPSAHIVAYCILEGEVITDAMSFFVRDTRLKQVRLKEHFIFFGDTSMNKMRLQDTFITLDKYQSESDEIIRHLYHT